MVDKNYRSRRQREIDEQWKKCFDEILRLRKQVMDTKDRNKITFFGDLHDTIQARYQEALRCYQEAVEKIDATTFSRPETKQVNDEAALYHYEDALKDSLARLKIMRTLLSVP